MEILVSYQTWSMEGVSGVKKVRRRALRKGQMETFQDFIDNALERFDFELSGDGDGDGGGSVLLVIY